MLFNFPLFTRLVERAYKNIDGSKYPLDDVIGIFRYYFQRYEDMFNRAHPNIRMEQIEKIIKKMPYIDDGFNGTNIAPDTYDVLIDKHFQTKYSSVDFNLNHFFSGDIRLMRFYETCYRDREAG